MSTTWERIRREIHRQNEIMRREIQAELDQENAKIRERLDEDRAAYQKDVEKLAHDLEQLWIFWRDVMGIGSSG